MCISEYITNSKPTRVMKPKKYVAIFDAFKKRRKGN